jgi:tetratricopeptide (TPR) repeat protein
MSDSPSSAEALKDDGNKLFKDANYRGAIKKYKEAISLQPLAALYTNRAACYVKLNKFRDAIQDCETAIALDKGWARAYMRKAEAHLQLNEPGAAVAILQAGLKQLPDNKDLEIALQKAHVENFDRIKRAQASPKISSNSPV